MFIEEEQLIGRTIQKLAILYNKVCIKFTDGTYTGINCRQKQHDFDTLTWEDLDGFELKTLGLISEEEYDKLKEMEQKQLLEHTKKDRRRQYEMLKKEFENG